MTHVNDSQIDNLVTLLDGYTQEGGHHLQEKLFWMHKNILKNILNLQ